MKIEIINNGTTEFPFYSIMVDNEEYCSTNTIEKAEKLVKLLTPTAVVQVCDKCNIPYTYDWHHQYYTCSKCGNDK